MNFPSLNDVFELTNWFPLQSRTEKIVPSLGAREKKGDVLAKGSDYFQLPASRSPWEVLFCWMPAAAQLSTTTLGNMEESFMAYRMLQEE